MIKHASSFMREIQTPPPPALGSGNLDWIKLFAQQNLKHAISSFANPTSVLTHHGGKLQK